MKTAVLFCLMGTAAMTQTTVYVSPIIYKKLLVCGLSYDPSFGNSFSYNSTAVNNPYFIFEAKKVSDRPSINLGVNFSIGVRDNKHLFGIELATDEVGTMSKISILSTMNYFGASNPPSNPPYSSYTYLLNTAFTMGRLSFTYSGLITPKSSNCKLYLNSDLSVFIAKANQFNYFWDDTTSQNQQLYYNQLRIISTSLNSSIMTDRKVLALGAGAKCDVGMSWKKRWHYFFTVDVNYRIGLDQVMGSGTTVEVIDGKTNEQLFFTYGLESKGSGLYFQLSRRFQLVPWKKN